MGFHSSTCKRCWGGSCPHLCTLAAHWPPAAPVKPILLHQALLISPYAEELQVLRAAFLRPVGLQLQLYVPRRARQVSCNATQAANSPAVVRRVSFDQCWQVQEQCQQGYAALPAWGQCCSAWGKVEASPLEGCALLYGTKELLHWMEVNGLRDLFGALRGRLHPFVSTHLAVWNCSGGDVCCLSPWLKCRALPPWDSTSQGLTGDVWDQNSLPGKPLVQACCRQGGSLWLPGP